MSRIETAISQARMQFLDGPNVERARLYWGALAISMDMMFVQGAMSGGIGPHGFFIALNPRKRKKPAADKASSSPSHENRHARDSAGR